MYGTSASLSTRETRIAGRAAGRLSSRPMASAPPSAPRRLQLHLQLPFKFDPRDDVRVKRLLDEGYRIEDLQRLTDREAIVILRRDETP